MRDVAAARAALAEAEAGEELRAGLAELDAIGRMARRQLAAMRWRQALTLQGSTPQQSLHRLPSARSPSAQPTLQQVPSGSCGRLTRTARPAPRLCRSPVLMCSRPWSPNRQDRLTLHVELRSIADGLFSAPVACNVLSAVLKRKA